MPVSEQAEACHNSAVVDLKTDYQAKILAGDNGLVRPEFSEAMT